MLRRCREQRMCRAKIRANDVACVAYMPQRTRDREDRPPHFLPKKFSQKN